MKLLEKTAIATVLLIGSVGAASALTLDSIPGVTGTSMSVHIENGVATLSGQAESGTERYMAEQYIARAAGVDKVINLATIQ